MLSETFLHPGIDNHNLQIEGYTILRCDNPNHVSRGGVCVYHKSDLSIRSLPDATKLNECMVFEVKVGRCKCIITALYHSPSVESNTLPEINYFISKLEQTLEYVNKRNPFISMILKMLKC